MFILVGIDWSQDHHNARIINEFAAHPDAPIFDSLPGAGDLLAPKLLVMFGDHRDRFPSPQTIRCLAGTCPVTDQSGKRKRVYFRKACHKDYRNTSQQFAKESTKQSEWAASYFADARARRLSKSEAFRCLANRWPGIIHCPLPTSRNHQQKGLDKACPPCG